MISQVLAEAAAAPAPKRPYSYVCPWCEHEAHVHLLDPAGDFRAGPYVCEVCGCGVAQTSHMIPLTHQRWEKWQRERLRAAS